MLLIFVILLSFKKCLIFALFAIFGSYKTVICLNIQRALRGYRGARCFSGIQIYMSLM